ncbi:protein of unknown function (plasmid) [Cupriavidus taiwanensis]|uniref:Uncharacterized protein n=1 Tax=Cupriavidus taiwanensis TaxID=164546 RepID=A0A375FHJ0_9BURK|nr:protein of unknown function [Cupriavidus taiwanensis]SPA11565.1 protein of unknown function [Cupriavidus taiwanensis]SPA57473.1 protein of unknown function [Cupriavidus taiwanensis]SPD49306.1 protein of unknown function [Cupriavidus taiwanensis]
MRCATCRRSAFEFPDRKSCALPAGDKGKIEVIQSPAMGTPVKPGAHTAHREGRARPTQARSAHVRPDVSGFWSWT